VHQRRCGCDMLRLPSPVPEQCWLSSRIGHMPGMRCWDWWNNSVIVSMRYVVAM
jgi:hypothetical protein